MKALYSRVITESGVFVTNPDENMRKVVYSTFVSNTDRFV
jgi:hypothetical protein